MPTAVRAYLEECEKLAGYTEFGFSKILALDHLHRQNYDTQRALQQLSQQHSIVSDSDFDSDEKDGSVRLDTPPVLPKDDDCCVCGTGRDIFLCDVVGCQRGEW